MCIKKRGYSSHTLGWVWQCRIVRQPVHVPRTGAVREPCVSYQLDAYHSSPYSICSYSPAGLITVWSGCNSPASVITSVARVSEPMLTNTSLPPIKTPKEGSVTPAQLQTALPVPTPASGMILSLALEPVSYLLVQRIRARQFVEMRDLLSDNIALHRQWEAAQGCVNVATMPMSLLPRFPEVPSLMSCVYCFLTYVLVRMVDEPIETARDMLSYCHLIIREAFWHGGEGWREYDRTFRSQVAIDPTIPWHSIRPELQATTLLGQHGALENLCSLCQGTDNQILRCAMQSWHHPSMASRLPAQSGPRQSPQRRPETLSRICSSWNSGACRYPGTCNFRHICATCQLGPHRARDCVHTPEDSTYKHPISRRTRLPLLPRLGGAKTNSTLINSISFMALLCHTIKSSDASPPHDISSRPAVCAIHTSGSGEGFPYWIRSQWLLSSATALQPPIILGQPPYS